MIPTFGRRDDNEADIVGALKQVGASVYRLAGTGIPDLIVGIFGRMYLLEVKGASGKLTKAQVKFRLLWKGPPPVTVRTPMEALQAVGAVGSGSAADKH